MSDEDLFLIDGRSVPELKVVELRKELEARSLPKSGNKRELVDRLVNHLRENQAEQNKKQNEEAQQQNIQQANLAPMMPDMVKEYLVQQQQLLEAERRSVDKHRASSSSTGAQSAEMMQQEESDTIKDTEPADSHDDATENATGRLSSIPDGTEETEKDQGIIDQDDKLHANKGDNSEVETSKSSTEHEEETDEGIKPLKNEKGAEIGQVGPNADNKDKEKYAAELAGDDDQPIEEREQNEEFVPDEPHVHKKKEVAFAPSKPDEVVVSQSSAPPCAKEAIGDEELDFFEQTIEEDEEEDAKREESDYDGGKRRHPSPVLIGNFNETTGQVQDSHISSASEPVKLVVTTAKDVKQTTGDDSGIIAGKHHASQRRSSLEESSKAPTEPQDLTTPEGFTRRRAVSPARNAVSRWIHIRGLKRPFTNQSLMELLGKFGTIDSDAFWIDNIKSNCIVTFDTEEQAQLARARLHNIVWPPASDGALVVEFSTEEKLKRRKAEVQEQQQQQVVGALNKAKQLGSGNGAVATAEEGLGLTIVVDNRSLESRSTPRVLIQHDKEQQHDAETRKRKAEELEKSQTTLDQLFKKTKTQPQIYFLPLSDEEAAKRKKALIDSKRSSSRNKISGHGGYRDHSTGRKASGHGSSRDHYRSSVGNRL